MTTFASQKIGIDERLCALTFLIPLIRLRTCLGPTRGNFQVSAGKLVVTGAILVNVHCIHSSLAVAHQHSTVHYCCQFYGFPLKTMDCVSNRKHSPFSIVLCGSAEYCLSTADSCTGARPAQPPKVSPSHTTHPQMLTDLPRCEVAWADVVSVSKVHL